MKDAQNILACRYAQAFINVFLDKLSPEDINAIDCTARYLAEHARIIFLLTVPALDDSKKKQAIEQLCAQFNVSEQVKKFMFVLIDHKRAVLLALALRCIVVLYKKEKNILTFSITTAQEVDKNELSVMQQFLARQTGSDIVYTHKVDPTLIAGVRMQSNFYVWEHSVKKHLHAMRLLIH
jgi:F-type H+-transporting ATPase subunit delta